MSGDWYELSQITRGRPMVVERVRLVNEGMAIEGSFELPPLAQLSGDDQVFVMAFIRSHGSIKRMEQIFGVSYPTIKNRLRRLSEQLPFVEVEPVASAKGVLEQIDRGEISVAEALEELRK